MQPWKGYAWGLAWSLCAFGWSGPALALDEVKCAAANVKAASSYSEYATLRTAYAYCIRYGDTSGTGLGSKDCDAAQARMFDAKYKHDEAVSNQRQYCR